MLPGVVQVRCVRVNGGVAQAVRGLLRSNPHASYTLRQVQRGIAHEALLCELSSVLSKFVLRGEAVRTLEPQPSGRRVNAFRWAG